MRYTNGGVESIAPPREGLFFRSMHDQNGVYVVSDRFFCDFNDPFLKGNKNESRPHYYTFFDPASGLFWMIPLSSRVEKYQAIIENRMAEHRPCDILHIAKLDNGKTSVFLIQDVFPITEGYIERPYTFNNQPLIITSEKLAATIEEKTVRVLRLIRRGIRFSNTQPDVLQIEHCLLSGEPFQPQGR